MNNPAPGSPAKSGFLGVLRSWLRTWYGENWSSPEELPMDAGGPTVHSYGLVRILVVDDNPVNLMVISVLMESRGLVPLLAADGAEAVALACEIRFDLIVMDLEMPILGGLAATAAIRRFEASSSRPSVPILAYSNTSASASALSKHGMNGSLHKPCADQDLEDCLVRWCPTYRSAPAAYGMRGDQTGWQAARRLPESNATSLR